MKRSLPVAWLAAACCGLMSMVVLGCAGTLDPGVGPGGGGGNNGTGGGNGCQVAILQTCAGCHFSAAGSAGLDLASPDIGSRLVGQPTGDASKGGACMGKTLLNPSSNPATGVFIDKITLDDPGCGSRMPLGNPLSASEITCMTDWATSLTSP